MAFWRSWQWVWVRKAAWPVTGVLLLGLGWADLRLQVIGMNYEAFEKFDADTAGALMLGSGLLAAVALLLWPWLGAAAQAPVTAVVAAVSLAVTVVVRLIVEMPSGTESGIRPVDSSVVLAEPAALLGLLGLTAWRGTPRAAALASTFCVLAIILRPLAAGLELPSMMVTFILTLTSVAALAIGLTVRLVAADRKRRETAVRLEQRAEFARDLHDFVAHHVTGIVIQAQGARSIAARRPDLVPMALERIEHAGAEALKSMRAMVGMLRDPGPADGGESRETVTAPLVTMAEVRTLVEEFAPIGGGRAVLRTEGDVENLPMEVVTTLHRVVMEALTNVRKHARDFTEVQVTLVRTGDRVDVTVRDDGRSRPGPQALQALGGGFGLKGLAERVGLIGGRVRSGPAPGGGWCVEATLPVGARAARTLRSVA
jgi:signal transduction histidine kinase